MRNFNAPVPGESLTHEPKKFAWERPPEITDPEEAIQMHIMRLSDPDALESIANALDIGAIDIYNLVQGIMRSAVAEGVHSIDVGLIAAPVVHEFIKRAAESLGVEYEEGLEDKEQREEYRRKIAGAKAKKLLQMPEPEVLEEVKEELEEDKPKGLMARRNK